jgi:hypothetical protein
MTAPLDYARYTQLPVLDTPATIALGHAILAAAPSKPEPNVREALSDLKASLKALEAAWQKRSATVSSDGPVAKEVDHEVDICWGSLASRLDALASLPPDKYPRAADARALKEQLFPSAEGMAFLTFAYPREWTEVKKRVDLIASAKLAGAIEKLAGTEWVSEVRRTFAAYGEVLGITKAAPTPTSDPENLRLLRQDLSGGICTYAIAVLATIRPKKKATVDAAAAALRPVDDVRARGSSAPGPAKPAPAPAPTPSQPAGTPS